MNWESFCRISLLCCCSMGVYEGKKSQLDDAQLSMSITACRKKALQSKAINLANHRKHVALFIVIPTDGLAH